MELYLTCLVVTLCLFGNSLAKEASKENNPDMEELMKMMEGLGGQAGPLLEGLLKGDKSGDKKGPEDWSSLLNMASSFLGDSGILDSLKDAAGKDGSNKSTESWQDIAKGLLSQNEAITGKLKNKLKREGESAVNQNWMLKLLNEILGKDTAFDLVPYIFRDLLSDAVKKKLKSVTEEDLLKLQNVYSNMEKFESWADILDSIEKEAPKFYQVAVDLYKTGKTKFNGFWSTLDKEPKELLSQLRTNSGEVLSTFKKSLVGMSQDGQKNLRDSLSKLHPGLKTFIDRLSKNKGVLVMYLNSIFEQQPELLEAVNKKKESPKKPDSEKEEL